MGKWYKDDVWTTETCSTSKGTTWQQHMICQLSDPLKIKNLTYGTPKTQKQAAKRANTIRVIQYTRARVVTNAISGNRRKQFLTS